MIESVEMIIRQPGHPDRVVRLQEGTSSLGRSEECDIVLSDVGVSRHHARVVFATNDVYVEDLRSGNGTYYRGERVEKQEIYDGDELIIDPFVLQFRVRGDTRPSRDEATLDGPLARLDVVSGPGLARTAFHIPARGLTLGRSETRDVVIPDPASSRHHCSVFFQDGHYVLRDMGSANGVYVNAYRVKESILTDGDRLQIGNSEFQFVLDDATKAGSGSGVPRPASSWHELGWVEQDDLSLPLAEASTPRAPGRRGGLGRMVSMALGGATLLTFMALVMLVSGALLYVVVVRAGAPTPTTKPSGQPAWQLVVSEVEPSTDVSTLFDQGLSAMRERQHRRALEHFYLTLLADPGNPSAERFAFVAGEYLVLGVLEAEVAKEAAVLVERKTRREELFVDTRKRGRRALLAKDALRKEFPDDPIVLEKMGWKPSAEAEALEERMLDAATAIDKEGWAEAAGIYTEVLEQSQDEALRTSARSGLKSARRELARRVTTSWRAGILAEAEGEVGEAATRYREMKVIDARNPSARVRLTRLENPGG